MIYNGWLGGAAALRRDRCADLPAAAVPRPCRLSGPDVGDRVGAHMVMPTPAGYRGEGVFDNFWKLIERWRVTFLITVPTAIAALMQRPVDADVSTLQDRDLGLGAAADRALQPLREGDRGADRRGLRADRGDLPCLVQSDRRAEEGRLGRPAAAPYRGAHPRPRRRAAASANARSTRSARSASPTPASSPDRPIPRSTRTATCSPRAASCAPAISGRLDADGYLWITGRAKDLIIRGGHNIDPAEIEEALVRHPAVAFVGAIGQPDAFAGRAALRLCRTGQGCGGQRGRTDGHSPRPISTSAPRCRSTSRS